MAEALRLWALLVRARARAQLQYRASFALNFAGVFVVTFLDFVVVLVIFQNVPQLAGFTVAEVAFLYAISSLAFSFTDLAIGHLDEFPQLVREGTFDLLLVRPLGTLFQVVTSDFALRRIAKALQGAIVLVYAVSALDVDWTLARVAMVLVMVVCGVAIFASIWIAGAATVIWTVEGSEWLNAFTYGGNFLTQYPVNLFGRWFRRLFVYLLPLGFVAYFPALYVLDKPDPLGLPRALQFASPLVAAAAVGVTALVWQAAVRHYRSAGG